MFPWEAVQADNPRMKSRANRLRVVSTEGGNREGVDFVSRTACTAPRTQEASRTSVGRGRVLRGAPGLEALPPGGRELDRSSVSPPTG